MINRIQTGSFIKVSEDADILRNWVLVARVVDIPRFFSEQGLGTN